jgi:TetR/AcrR family transcriptional repressor of nem operon
MFISSLTKEPRNRTMTRGPERQFDRQEVLGKAMAYFWSHGYEPTGLTDLTREMGIGRQSLYNTFGDKRNLFLEALELYFQQGVEPMLAILRSPAPALDNVKSVFAFWQQMAENPECSGCMIGNTLAEFGQNDMEVQNLVKRYVGRLEKAIYQTLVRARNEGTLRSRLSERDLARTLITTSQGGALLSKAGGGPSHAKSVLGALWHLLTTE